MRGAQQGHATATCGGVALAGTIGWWVQAVRRTVSRSISIWISFETRTPPVSTAMFQVMSKSSRLTLVRAEKTARSPPQGSGVSLEEHLERDLLGHAVDGEVAVDGARRAGPLDAGAPEGCLRVLVHVEELGGLDVLVAGGAAGLDRGHVDGDVDTRVFDVLADHHGAGDAGETPAHLGDHEVASDEGHVGVARVDVPGAGRRDDVAGEVAGGSGGDAHGWFSLDV